jgi:serine/threonine protein kinase
MTTGSSTISPKSGSTVTGKSSPLNGPDEQLRIESEWRTSGDADLVAVLRRSPNILRDKSLLLNLAVREFQARCRLADIEDLEQHCRRFREFGGSIERSIFRQLDVQRVVDSCFKDSAFDTAPDWPRAGEQFGTFNVLELLGIGSVARVYLCQQSDLGDRHVVVKASPQASIEPSILGKLDHPNITPIYSTGRVESKGLDFLCMPYCGRSTLADLIDLAFATNQPSRTHLDQAATRWSPDNSSITHPAWRRVLPIVRTTYFDCVLDLAISIAGALEHAHHQRILHGDLKPSNVLLATDRRPLLLDFNLSQDFAGESRRCGGTLPYMPPEYLHLVADRGSIHRESKFHPATDIFSFGALLHELLYGATPLTMPKSSCTSAEIAAHFLEQYRNGIQLRKYSALAISGRLASLIKSCLAFDPQERPPSMAHVRDLLGRERRWSAKLSRRAKAQPVAFATLTALGVAAAIGAGSYAALLPSRHERAYADGITAASAGDMAAAVSRFNKALSLDPSFAEARFARGRAYVHSQKLDFAMIDFEQLAQAGDARAMAMLGYCFNLQDVKVAAVPWYEKALDSGAASVAIHNNLGACYLVTQTHLTRIEQLERAEKHLKLALAGEPDSITVQLNNVRLATVKSAADATFDPSTVWPLAFSILKANPGDQFIEIHIDVWYRSLRQYSERVGKSAELPQAFGIDREAWRLFESVHQHERSLPDLKVPRPNISRSKLPSSEESYFLEPFLADSKL